MIRVLIVEDDPVVAEAHRVFVERIEGYRVIGVAGSGREAMAVMRKEPVDLVLLDFYLPDTTGLAVCRALRRSGLTADVIAVTSARDLEVVRTAVSLGVVQYIVKPFTGAMLKDKLERYADYHRQTTKATGPLAQHEVDAIITRLRGSSLQTLPKKISEETLQQVIVALRDAERALSAADMGEEVGVARVTARRYLEYLADIDLAEREAAYGGPGRPEYRYRWAGRD